MPVKRYALGTLFALIELRMVSAVIGNSKLNSIYIVN